MVREKNQTLFFQQLFISRHLSTVSKLFRRMGDKLKNAFFTFVTAVGTLWNFLFLKTQDPDESDLQSNEIRQDVINHLFETD